MIEFNLKMEAPQFFAKVAEGCADIDIYNYLEHNTDLFKNTIKINLYLKALDFEIKGEDFLYQDEVKKCDSVKKLNDLKRKYEVRAINIYNVQTLLEENLHNLKQPVKAIQINAPVIGLFCNLAAESKLFPKDENISVRTYCESVCAEFKLSYSDRVRQNYNASKTKQNMQKLKTLILPTLKKDAQEIINDYLDKKDLTKRNLYG